MNNSNRLWSKEELKVYLPLLSAQAGCITYVTLGSKGVQEFNSYPYQGYKTCFKRRYAKPTERFKELEEFVF